MALQRVEFRMPGPKVVKLVVLGSPSPPDTDMRKVLRTAWLRARLRFGPKSVCSRLVTNRDSPLSFG